MPFYTRTNAHGGTDIWEIDQSVRNLCVSSPSGINLIAAVPGKTGMDLLREHATGWFLEGNPFTELTIAPGRYFPRIARPHVLSSSEQLWTNTEDLKALIATSASQAAVLATEIARICRTVHPQGRNLKSYGNDTRNLLILACTEVEMHCRGVLLANQYPNEKPTIEDAKTALRDVLRLHEYRVSFPAYPWLSSFAPFDGWQHGKSLDWWSAYNGVKHNRENEFQKATLKNVFSAVAANVVLLVAQFGGAGYGRETELSRFIKLDSKPSWEIRLRYWLLPGVAEWQRVAHPLIASALP